MPRHKKRNAALAPAGDEHTESMPDLPRNGHSSCAHLRTGRIRFLMLILVTS